MILSQHACYENDDRSIRLCGPCPVGWPQAMAPRALSAMRIAPRCARLAALALAVSAVVSCHSGNSDGCLIGPCVLAPPAMHLSLVGFPPNGVDRGTVVSGGYRGTLRVGESVTLYVVRSFGPGATPADTIRTDVRWALSDSLAASIATMPDGGGRLTGVVVGTVGAVMVNQQRYDVMSCFNIYGGCDQVSTIAVTP